MTEEEESGDSWYEREREQDDEWRPAPRPHELIAICFDGASLFDRYRADPAELHSTQALSRRKMRSTTTHGATPTMMEICAAQQV